MTSNGNQDFPRLPLDGNIDLTYRCNNSCRHCWLWLPEHSIQEKDELSVDEIQRIVSDARKMGCNAWSISGGEPMLRQDFFDIFDFITRKSVTYHLNTNGTLITPKIAQLLTRNGRKMVAIYGATADVHDKVTRNPGSFNAVMRGFAYLREARASFEVQIVPMRDNFHQYTQMLELARSLSPYYRIGAPWLWLTAKRSEKRNCVISSQRLSPTEVLLLDRPNPLYKSKPIDTGSHSSDNLLTCERNNEKNKIFSACIDGRRDFHIDPYGKMSFCCFIKDPALRYDLRKGAFSQAWDEFIPSQKELVYDGPEYQENCGSCELRKDCRWCGVYGYLEHGRYSAKVEYLCQIAAEVHQYKLDWRAEHFRYYKIAGINIEIASDKPFTEKTFDDKFKMFQVDGPGEDNISWHITTPIPFTDPKRFGKEIYHKSPWIIYKQDDAWTYLGVSNDGLINSPHLLAIFNHDHTRGTIYRNSDFKMNSLGSLSSFPTDQVLLANVLADKHGCYFHSSGIILDGNGLLFLGHSTAGKSTILKLLRGHGEILCDDRMIVRRWPEGFRIHGTWSHGELPDVSPASAPLKAIFYLEKAPTNELISISDKRERIGRMLSHVIRPLITADWWEKILDVVGKASIEVPAYRLRFDKSGEVVELIKQLCADERDG